MYPCGFDLTWGKGAKHIATAPHTRVGSWSFGLILLLLGWCGALNVAALETDHAPLRTLRHGYTVSLRVPKAVFQRQRVEVVVQVQSVRGQPVDGLPVEFYLDPSSTRYTSLAPTRATTRRGIARAFLRVDHVGTVRVVIHAGSITKRADIMVLVPVATRLQYDAPGSNPALHKGCPSVLGPGTPHPLSPVPVGLPAHRHKTPRRCLLRSIS
jgi:hypothetical protein